MLEPFECFRCTCAMAFPMALISTSTTHVSTPGFWSGWQEGGWSALNKTLGAALVQSGVDQNRLRMMRQDELVVLKHLWQMPLFDNIAKVNESGGVTGIVVR